MEKKILQQDYKRVVSQLGVDQNTCDDAETSSHMCSPKIINNLWF